MLPDRLFYTLLLFIALTIAGLTASTQLLIKEKDRTHDVIPMETVLLTGLDAQKPKAAENNVERASDLITIREHGNPLSETGRGPSTVISYSH